jgi:hypothetical protein
VEEAEEKELVMKRNNHVRNVYMKEHVSDINIRKIKFIRRQEYMRVRENIKINSDIKKKVCCSKCGCM